MIDTIRQNPVPTAVAALGLGWLALRFRDQQSAGSGIGSAYRDRCQVSRVRTYMSPNQ
jgi:hypothetical protein